MYRTLIGRVQFLNSTRIGDDGILKADCYSEKTPLLTENIVFAEEIV